MNRTQTGQHRAALTLLVAGLAVLMLGSGCATYVGLRGFYRYPADAAVTQALVQKTCDISGAQEIDIGASSNDDVAIIEVEPDNQVVIVKFIPQRAGVA